MNTRPTIAQRLVSLGLATAFFLPFAAVTLAQAAQIVA